MGALGLEGDAVTFGGLAQRQPSRDLEEDAAFGIGEGLFRPHQIKHILKDRLRHHQSSEPRLALLVGLGRREGQVPGETVSLR